MNRQLQKNSRSKFIFLQLILLLSCLSTSCVAKKTRSHEVPQQISLTRIVRLEPAFTPMSDLERYTEWGKELNLGKRFAQNEDLPTALFCFKRAHMISQMSSHMSQARRQEIEYDLFLTYYLQNNYKEAAHIFEASSLSELPETSPLRPQILAMLIECYDRLGKTSQVINLFEGLKIESPETYRKMACWYHVTHYGQIPKKLSEELSTNLSTSSLSLSETITAIQNEMVPPLVPETLNAILPGSGFAYLGQYKTALTSFALNGLFIAAGVQFLSRGEVAFGLITLGAEVGWYGGGILGGGLAAQHYNEKLWKNRINSLFDQERIFPVLQLKYGF